MSRCTRPRAKILASLLATLMVSLLACSAASRPATVKMGGDDRLRWIVLNGFAVVNPDYQINFLQMKSAGLLDRKITRAGSGAVVPVILEARSAQSFSWGKWVQAEITVEQSGRISTPTLGVWELTKLLTSANSISNKPGSVEHKSLSGLQSLQVVIWLKGPINEDGLSDSLPRAAKLDMILLSPGSNGRKPIGWDAQEDCTLRGMGICRSDRTLTGQFKQWVSLLTENDEKTLIWLGLNLHELQLYAMKGKVYGAIVTLPPVDLIDIQSQPAIAWTRIVGAQF